MRIYQASKKKKKKTPPQTPHLSRLALAGLWRGSSLLGRKPLGCQAKPARNRWHLPILCSCASAHQVLSQFPCGACPKSARYLLNTLRYTIQIPWEYPSGYLQNRTSVNLFRRRHVTSEISPRSQFPVTLFTLPIQYPHDTCPAHVLYYADSTPIPKRVSPNPDKITAS